MSSSGINATNSGPLIIRTYNDNSSNKTYILGDYDYPVASNLVLITSTNGQLVPSSAPHISTATLSSIQISSLFDSDGILGTTGEVLHTDGSQIYWAPSGAGSGYWSENGTKIFNNNNGGSGIGSGFVGVNTNNPTSNLQVNGTFQVQADSELAPFKASNGNYLFVKPNNNGFVNLGAYNTGTGPKSLVLQLESGGAIGGNVGINISAPQFMLDVAGDIHTSGVLSTNIINMSSNNLAQGQIFGLSTINGIEWPPTDDAVWSKNGNDIYNDNSGSVIISTILQSSSIKGVSTINMNTGQISGLSSVNGPATTLALNGNVSVINDGEVTAYTNTLNGNYIYIDTYSNGNNFIRLGGYNKNALGPGLGSGKNISFFVSPSGVPDGGYLGIATSSPQCMLDVQGASVTKQILTSSLTTNIGTGGNWQDYYGKYVFVSTTNTLTLPTTGVSEGSVLIFRNLDLTNSLTINNCFTGGSPIPSNGAASFIFTTLYGGSTWVSM